MQNGKKHNNYMVYIMTAFETEIENQFKTKKEMNDYLKGELWVKKEMESICVLTFKLDAEGYKTTLNTKYSFDNRWS